MANYADSYPNFPRKTIWDEPVSWSPLSKPQAAAAESSAADPTQQQHSYDQARQSVLGDLSSSPMAACQECMANAKAARRKERLD